MNHVRERVAALAMSRWKARSHRTLETLPPQGTHWSTRNLAQELGLSQTAVSRIWRAFALQPHRTESFKLSADPFFIEKVCDIVGLYLNPPDRAIVWCVDEKSQIQALDRTRPVLALRPGVPERQTHDYLRYGTTSLFAALDVAPVKSLACHRRHRHQEFIQFLERIDAHIAADQDVHLVMDNYGTHKVDKVRRWFVKHPNYQVHFTRPPRRVGSIKLSASSLPSPPNAFARHLP